MTMAKFDITLRFDGDDPWEETIRVKLASLNDADNLATRMQVERDADAVYVVEVSKCPALAEEV